MKIACLIAGHRSRAVYRIPLAGRPELSRALGWVRSEPVTYECRRCGRPM